MYCGYCVEVCPELAILMSSKNYEFSKYDKAMLIYQKDALLENLDETGDQND